ncbi:hypothetical protein [Streptomyces sp. NPDC007172]|uniref:hypothetical protein n=1 Tax=Streptomyces sp. NPDC007172 TaxID=3364776 RepID=UPI0036BF51B0
MTPSRHTASDRLRRLALADAAAAPTAPTEYVTLASQLPTRCSRRAMLLGSLADVKEAGEPK